MRQCYYSNRTFHGARRDVPFKVILESRAKAFRGGETALEMLAFVCRESPQGQGSLRRDNVKCIVRDLIVEAAFSGPIYQPGFTALDIACVALLCARRLVPGISGLLAVTEE